MELLSHKVNSLEPSATIAFTQMARELRNQGNDVISLSVGEPDFNTPDFIKIAAKKAIEDNYSSYTPVAGYLELREAISRKLKRENNLDYKTNQIVASTGAKQSIINTLICLLDPKDEVLIPAPFWVSYYQMTQIAGGVPKTIESCLENDFKITPEQLEQAISPKTKVFLFSTPCNPSGAIYSKEELEALAEVFKKYPRIMVVSDEIYEHINYVDKIVSMASIEGMYERTVTINGVSKAYAMTGWRLGYLAAPQWLAKAVDSIQGQFTSGACSIAQRAAITALDGGVEKIQYMLDAFKERRELMFDLLSSIEGLKFKMPEGAFYFFPDVSNLLNKTYRGIEVKTSHDLCLYLLENAHVALVPGSAFGMNNCIRISYAASPEQLKEAIKRIKEALK